jgi:hypothetical protein
VVSPLPSLIQVLGVPVEGVSRVIKLYTLYTDHPLNLSHFFIRLYNTYVSICIYMYVHMCKGVSHYLSRDPILTHIHEFQHVRIGLPGPVSICRCQVFYELSGFHQNHRLYVDSRVLTSRVHASCLSWLLVEMRIRFANGDPIVLDFILDILPGYCEIIDKTAWHLPMSRRPLSFHSSCQQKCCAVQCRVATRK